MPHEDPKAVSPRVRRCSAPGSLDSPPATALPAVLKGVLASVRLTRLSNPATDDRVYVRAGSFAADEQEAAAKAAELNIVTSGDARTVAATPLAKQGNISTYTKGARKEGPASKSSHLIFLELRVQDALEDVASNDVARTMGETLELEAASAARSCSGGGRAGEVVGRAFSDYFLTSSSHVRTFEERAEGERDAPACVRRHRAFALPPRTPGVRLRYAAGCLKRFLAVSGENGLKLSWEALNVRL